MEFTGKFQNITKDWQTGKYTISFTVNEQSALNEVENIQKCEKLSIKAVQHSAKRSLDANGLFWVCCGKIAEALRTDKWDIYLQMLKRYGQFTYICVKPKMVDAVKLQWRECEVVGEIEINGQKAIQMLVYFGSSLYDQREFSILLDGVISEMREMGLETPTSEQMRLALERLENVKNTTP